MNYYRFNIGDYRKDTQGLSHAEHYIYRTLIDECFLTELPLSTDIRELIRFLRLTSDQKDDLSYVLDKFFELTEAGYVNDRVTFELSRAYERSDKARASANRRWNKSERKANAKKRNANAMRTHSERKEKGCSTDAKGMLPQYPNTPIPQPRSKATSKGANGKFKAPTTEEVDTYLAERKIEAFNSETFCDFYIARGWELSNGKKMKDWKAAVRTWENRRNNEKPPASDYGKGGI